MGTAAVLLAQVRWQRPEGLRTLCLLRATTGIPCPLCGGTTAAVGIGQGRIVDGLAANPFVVVAVAGLVLAPLGLWRRLALPTRRGYVAAIAGAVTASWAWQLVRYDVL